MKINRFYAILQVLISCCMLTPETHSQQANASWTVRWETSKVFVENAGQFQALAGQPEVNYAFDDGQTKICFTKKSVIYRFSKKTPLHNAGEKEEPAGNSGEWLEKEKEEHAARTTSDNVLLTWENASEQAELQPLEEAQEYFSYTISDKGAQRNLNHLKAYKKLCYKNLYPGIDLIFSFHPDHGIKYQLILHPDANISQVRMNWHNASGLSIRDGGDVHVSTRFGDLVDHSPVTFYENEHGVSISSSFEKKGSIVSFRLGAYDHSRTVVVDPWTITPAFPNSNKIWEVERDGAGNVYLYGGDMPLTLKKFNSGGTLIWTYNTPWDTTTYWTGSFITDLAGNSYITSGSNGEISKINTGGGLVWHNNPNGAFGPLFEYWHLALNCDQTKLVVGGMRAQSALSTSSYRGAVISINLTNGAVLSYVAVGNMSGLTIKEVRSIASSPNGNYYFLTLDSVGCVTPALALTFKAPTTYNFAYGSPSYGVTNQGISSIRATAGFIYTQNGTTVHKRNIGTGAVVASAAIPGGISVSGFGGNAPGNSGLDIDSCGNVYVGSGNQLVKYDANLNLLSSSITPAAVYDVAVNSGGEVVVCGNGFASSINILACHPVAAICSSSSPLSVLSTSVNLNCNGQCTGTATANPSGGTTPYTYSWNSIPAQTTATATALCAGTFTCIVTDASGNTSPTTVTITQPPAITSSATPVNVSCNGGANGSASVTASGGTGALTYSWNTAPVQTTATATGLPQGTYTCTITDANGCTHTQAVTLTQPAALTSSPSSVNANCGNNNGSATTTASGGTGTLTYSWNTIPAQTTATASGLGAGTYSCTITDANGCTHLQAVTVTQSSTLTSTSTQTNLTCNAGNNGTATATPAGGTGPYTYSWNTTPAQTSAMATGLTAGTYSCTITDASGCTFVQTVTLTQPAGIIATTSTVNATCGNNNGSATVSASGGTGTLTYSWNTTPAQTTATASGVGAGTYTCTVTDANGCTHAATAAVNNNNGPVVTLQAQTNELCNGGANGSATVNVTSGTGPYTYSWNTAPSQTTATATSLASGTYTITVTDANGCIQTQTVTITQPGIITASAVTNSASCNSTNGSATVTASGGTGTLTYSWTPSGGNTASAINLGAGTYTCTITDANGCTHALPVSITNSNAPTVTLSFQANINCSGGSNGSATVSVSGGTGPYTYSWNTTPAQTTATATGLMAGTYTITVQDASGCVQIQTVTITQPSILDAISSSAPACGSGNGSATATATGGTGPYTYSWTPSGGSGITASGLTSGTYTCMVTDAHGCTQTTSVNVVVNPAPVANAGVSLTILAGATTQLNATGGTTYTWTPATGLSCMNCANPLATPSATTTYCVKVMNSSGCADSACVTVTVDLECGHIFVPTAFSPNNDGENDFECIFGNTCIQTFEFAIYDRWGEKVFESTTPKTCWDGTYKGELMNTAVFVYYLNATLVTGEHITKKGNISLIR